MDIESRTVYLRDLKCRVHYDGTLTAKLMIAAFRSSIVYSRLCSLIIQLLMTETILIAGLGGDTAVWVLVDGRDKCHPSELEDGSSSGNPVMSVHRVLVCMKRFI